MIAAPTVTEALAEGVAEESTLRAVQDRLPAHGLLTLRQLRLLPKPEWLIKGILPMNAVGILYGQSGSYKSFLVLDWALHTAFGLAWNGHEVKQGQVVYVAAEGAEGYVRRAEAWRLHHSISQADLDAAPFRLRTDPVQLLHAGHLDAFLASLAAAECFQPMLIVIDTLGRSMDGGEENNNSDIHKMMSAADRIRRQTSAQVLLVHHEGHQHSGPRGGSALRNDVTTLLHLKRAGRNPREVRLECQKQKDADENWAISLGAEMIPISQEESSLVLVAREGTPNAPPSDPTPVGVSSHSRRQTRTRPPSRAVAQVVQALRRGGPEPMTAAQVARMIRKNDVATRKVLERACEQGAVIRPSRGRYALPQP